MKTLVLTLLLTATTLAYGTNSEPPAKLTSEAQEALSRAFLDYYIREFNQSVKTGADFAQFLAAGLPKSQKADLVAYFSTLGEAPRLSRENQVVTFHFKDYDIHVRWPSYAKNQVFIEGMAWVFDPSAPAKFQFENFDAKLKSYVANNKQASNWFFPAAEAGLLSKVGSKAVEACLAQSSCKWISAGIGTALLVNAGSDTWAGLKSASYNLGCLALSPAKPWYWGFCFEWKKNWDKAEEYEKAREPVKTDANIEWIPNQGQQCPRDEKGNEIYDAWVGETTKNAKGEWIQKNKWYHFYGKGKDSMLTEGYILSKNQSDAKEPSLAEAQFIYTKADKPVLERIKLKARKENPDDKDEFISILTTDQDSIIPIPYREENRRLKLIAMAAETWYKTCRLLARGAKIAPGMVEEGVKQMQEQPDKPTTSPSPAPVTQ